MYEILQVLYETAQSLYESKQTLYELAEVFVLSQSELQPVSVSTRKPSSVNKLKLILFLFFLSPLISTAPSQISSFGDSKVPRSINKAAHRRYVIANGNVVTIDWRHHGFHTSVDAGSRVRLRLELCSSFFVLVDSLDDNR